VFLCGAAEGGDKYVVAHVSVPDVDVMLGHNRKLAILAYMNTEDARPFCALEIIADGNDDLFALAAPLVCSHTCPTVNWYALNDAAAGAHLRRFGRNAFRILLHGRLAGRSSIAQGCFWRSAARVDGSRPNLASVLQEARETTSIHASTGAIWGIPAQWKTTSSFSVSSIDSRNPKRANSDAMQHEEALDFHGRRRCGNC
jgi:hypothetical protein